ncbi:hypothetical protein [Vulgatibacter sp.]
MKDTELELERKADDAWTGPRLIVLAVVTLTVALGIITILARSAAPY